MGRGGGVFSGHGDEEIAAYGQVLALIYDRTFLAGSFAGAWKARRKLYVWLFSSWVLFVVLLVMGGGRGGTVNSHMGGFRHWNMRGRSWVRSHIL